MMRRQDRDAEAEVISRLVIKYNRSIAIRTGGGAIVVSDGTTDGRGATLAEAVADYERKVQR